jgi:predicted hotdog family 3-hydroxylacyl-ACP dehydratase
MNLPEINLPEIRTLLPQAGAMVLLDRLVAADTDTLCAELEIGPGSLFCDGQGVGAWVGVEYMAQAVAAHAGYGAYLRGEPVRVGFLLGARRYEASQPLFAVGSVLHVHVQRALQGENGLAAFECRIDDAASGATAATATITVFEPENAAAFLERSPA